ncbi:MAG: amino acid adenylation domain-containing protein, partial [Chloroflexi bacterium]
LPAEQFHEVEKFDLSVLIDDSGPNITGQISYATALFKQATIARMIDHYLNLLEQLTARPELPYDGCSLLGAAEYETIVHAWNATDREHPQDRTLHEVFQEQAARTPSRTAVVYEGRRLTYEELDQRSNQLARFIRARYEERTGRPLTPGTLVALYVDRGLEMPVGMLAVLKAGAAYVPIDVHYPQERVDYLLQDTGTELILTCAHGEASRTAALPEDRVIDMELGAELYLREDASHLPPVSRADDLAYVIYTSGTTGKSKGVPIEHRQVMNLVCYHDQRYSRFSKSLAVALLSAYNFDFSVQPFFNTLLFGHTLHIVSRSVLMNPAAFNDYLLRNRIEVFEITPTLFSALVVPFTNYHRSDVKWINIGGENLQAGTVARFLEASSHIGIINSYGPTENTVDTAVYEIAPGSSVPDEQRSISIGKPIDNTRVYVLDRNKRVVPVGVTGELHVGGAGLTRGYLNRPDLNRDRFIHNPFATEADRAKGYTRLYKTGDLVRWLPSGPQN